MRILVTGAGAVGGYFGARLIEAGRDVTFLVRPRRRDQLAAGGLVVRSPDGDVKLSPQLVTAEDLTEPYDLILLTVKSYGLDALINDLRPAVGTQTVIIPALNGMRHLDVLREAYGEKLIFGGVCKIAAQLDPDGSVRHLGMEPSWSYGELDGSASERAQQIHETLQAKGFQGRLTNSIMIEMWEKWVFIASAAAAACLLRGSVGEIEAVGGAPVVEKIIDEATAVAAAAGFTTRPAAEANARQTLTAAGSTFTASLYRDLLQGLPIEADQIIGDLLDRGQQAGLELPLLMATRTALDVYQRVRTAV